MNKLDIVRCTRETSKATNQNPSDFEQSSTEFVPHRTLHSVFRLTTKRLSSNIGSTPLQVCWTLLRVGSTVLRVGSTLLKMMDMTETCPAGNEVRYCLLPPGTQPRSIADTQHPCTRIHRSQRIRLFILLSTSPPSSDAPVDISSIASRIYRVARLSDSHLPSVLQDKLPRSAFPYVGKRTW